MSKTVISSTEGIVRAVERVVATDDRPVLLHGPSLEGNCWTYVKQCIDTAWVSSAGAYVEKFEKQLTQFTGAKFAVAVVNGTCALHVALQLAGVQRDDEVLMPSLTFIATANATSFCGAVPHFVDVEERSLGVDPAKLAEYLEGIAELRDGRCFNRTTGRRIAAMLPMHTFGHPVDLDPLVQLCERWGIPLVEDAAESLGSYYRGKHTGRFGRLSILSFNGNKTITTGAGGAILTDDAELARLAKHITTTAKLPHKWEYVHDMVGYNYRMPNLNAALGCAQLEYLPKLLDAKRRLAERYMHEFADVMGMRIFREPDYAQSNYWLNALLLDEPDLEQRNQLLEALNAAKIQTRPIWTPMHELTMYERCPRADLSVTRGLAHRIVNLPSSAFLTRD